MTIVLERKPVPETGPIDLASVLDLVSANAPKARSDRMVPAAVVEGLRDAGLFRSFIPRSEERRVGKECRL